MKNSEKGLEKIGSCAFYGYPFVMPRKENYALGVQAIRIAYDKGKIKGQPKITLEDKKEIIRPLTFKENLESRVNAYETIVNEDGIERSEKERLGLFNAFLSSCTGIAYKARTSKFKIIPVCKELILIDKDFDKSFCLVDYDSLEGIELDRRKHRYHQLLLKSEVLEHPAWRVAVEDDLELLKTYRDIVFSVKNEDDWLMSFQTGHHYKVDLLKCLTACPLRVHVSIASGCIGLDVSKNFLGVV